MSHMLDNVNSWRQGFIPSGSSGTIATLAFTGNYKTSSFTSASDGHGGGDILFT
jgi:hypothetical protein